MNAMIDTHAYYRALRGAGFSDEQADAMTSGLAAATTNSLATKADLAELRAELKTEIANLRVEFNSDLSKHDLRLAGFLATYTTLIVGVGTAINHFAR